MTGHDIAAEARRWIDTPYHHQARAIGVGCDCGGLVGGVAVALGVVPPTWWEAVFDPAFAGYSRQADGNTLQRICETFMTRVAAPAVGDVLLMRFKRHPQHLGIVGDYVHGGLSLIHALSTVHFVREHVLDAQWRSHIVAVYRMPGVTT